MKKPESLTERIWRYRGVLAVAAVPVLLVVFILLLVPRKSPLYDHTHSLNELRHQPSNVKHTNEPQTGTRYAVVLDAGSTGSRVHIFKFDQTDRDLKLISDTFEQIKPGLSAYADKAGAAIDSLKPLLDLALKTVPLALRAQTPISLMATAGLRLLPAGKADKILAEISEGFTKLPFRSGKDSVMILEGQQEGAFAWLTLNYLLGTLGGDVKQTVAAIDLGGGSVQEAFAVEDGAAEHPPPGHIVTLRSTGKNYNVYVHSYLGYGLMAARAKVLEATDATAATCFAPNATVSYAYAGKTSNINPTKAANQPACAATSTKILELEKSCGGVEGACSFSGAWRGKGPGVGRQYYLSSYFWDRAVETGIVTDSTALQWSATPSEFLHRAGEACALDHAAVVKKYGVPENHAPFLCMDLTYCHTLLTKGFRLQDTARIIIVKQIKYNGQNIEAAWPLGAAINDLAASSS